MGLAEREAEMQELETSRPGRSRDLFGVQLEVNIITHYPLFYCQGNDEIIHARQDYLETGVLARASNSDVRRSISLSRPETNSTRNR